MPALVRLRRNHVAIMCGFLFVLVVLLCLSAPLVAQYIAHSGPNDNHITDTITVGGETENVVSLSGVPIGPTWHGQFFLGADTNGRDVFVRVLYGGRTSLEIGFLAATLTMTVATCVGLLAGYYRGWFDGIVSRVLDFMWAYPVILLAISLGTILAVSGIEIGPLHLKAGSLAVPVTIIGVVHIPYVARPIRGQVLSIREREFIDASRMLGMSSVRIMVTDVLPNLIPTIVVFAPLMVATSILLEAGLSFLGVGVQLPSPSWGNMIGAGVGQISSAPHGVLVPGLFLVTAVLGINGFADGLREAVDPRSRMYFR